MVLRKVGFLSWIYSIVVSSERYDLISKLLAHGKLVDNVVDNE